MAISRAVFVGGLSRTGFTTVGDWLILRSSLEQKVPVPFSEVV